MPSYLVLAGIDGDSSVIYSIRPDRWITADFSDELEKPLRPP